MAMSPTRRRYAIAVHAGAGSISIASAPARTKAIERALIAARDALLCVGGNAVAAAVAAVAHLEDDESCNAGFGSSLTEEGTVECDASVMDGGHHTYGACGATPGVKHPVHLAARLLELQQGPSRPLGRVHPMLLVGAGARRWAQSEGLEVVEGDGALVSARARRLYQRMMRDLHEEEAAAEAEAAELSSRAPERSSKRPRRNVSSPAVPGPSITNDTVGAVVCDGTHVASAVRAAAIKQPNERACGRLHAFLMRSVAYVPASFFHNIFMHVLWSSLAGEQWWRLAQTLGPRRLRGSFWRRLLGSGW